jgi:hypothetical protein
MLNDEWEGKGLDDPEFRKLFTRENLLASDWYAARLAAKQKIDRKFWRGTSNISTSFCGGWKIPRTGETLEGFLSP